MEHWQRN